MILSWGGKMVVACGTQVSVFLNLDPQIASDAIWGKIVVSYLRQNNTNYTQLKDFWGGGGGGGRGWNSPLPVWNPGKRWSGLATLDTLKSERWYGLVRLDRLTYL